MSQVIAVLIETLVAGLLAVTIGYCVVLDRKLRRLRMDEQQMRSTVIELGFATERAERAIDALKRTLADCDQSLAERLRNAEKTTADLEGQIRSGDDVLARIGKIITAAKAAERGESGQEPLPAPKLAGTVAAAQAFASRARKRLEGQAA